MISFCEESIILFFCSTFLRIKRNLRFYYNINIINALGQAQYQLCFLEPLRFVFHG